MALGRKDSKCLLNAVNDDDLMSKEDDTRDVTNDEDKNDGEQCQELQSFILLLFSC